MIIGAYDKILNLKKNNTEFDQNNTYQLNLKTIEILIVYD